ncbi:CPBP family intramembrane metalloprotease domain-containing protein [Nostoc sp. CENA543]|uniref:CPBP family intramembrane glutamic endopeptidase n=1 Tax=Nostoc sp. CENA543 TaxID=1869241 RepID=UPI000CA235EC|nr:type II CAAX endopeptidase family protein [Nostoc sp. CENA543]AUT01488.1 CPBP family intramembrane metalloprotease domain-containing protein [Nostoc sp. CENA543]
MTFKRLFLFFILTPIAAIIAASSLLGTLQEPQFQSRLELYQTNIVLQAQAWQPGDSQDDSSEAIRDAILGEQPLESATEKYQQTRQSVQTNLAKVQQQLAQLQSSNQVSTPPKPLPETPPTANISISQKQQQLEQSQQKMQKFLDELDLQLGILQAKQGKTDTAIKIWSELKQSTVNSQQSTGASALGGSADLKQLAFNSQETAAVLSGLWSDPPRLLPDAQQVIQSNLSGWFRSTALIQLYQLQQRETALSEVQTAQQATAAQAVFKLAVIGTVPALAALLGVILLIFLIAQRLLKGKESILAQNEDLAWATPWDGEIILQVFVVGFFFMGQLFVPFLLMLLPIPRPIVDIRLQAASVLVSYLLVAGGALLVMYFSLKQFFPLPRLWFKLQLRDNWFLWGFGGYCAALPIVIVVSLINQQLWQGQGGSNPLLQLALESQDFVALGIFYVTAAIAAPLFEEVLFRGFLLPSLTKYLPVWGSILASGLLFAIAHLSLSEVLPLTALGIVLGVVYTRSRNLLAPMLLHSLWNSGTLISLFLLGSGN